MFLNLSVIDKVENEYCFNLLYVVGDDVFVYTVLF